MKEATAPPLGGVVSFPYPFGEAVPWSDAPYSGHLVARHEPAQATPPAALGESEEARDLPQVVLVDAGTGIIRALRSLSFSPAYSAALRRASRAQAARPWVGAREYDRLHPAAYRRYPTSAAMVQAATAKYSRSIRPRAIRWATRRGACVLPAAMGADDPILARVATIAPPLTAPRLRRPAPVTVD